MSVDANTWVREPGDRRGDGYRAHWFLNDARGVPLNWTIIKMKDGFYICKEPWPTTNRDWIWVEIERGPFATLKEAKVVYRLQAALGKVKEYKA